MERSFAKYNEIFVSPSLRTNRGRKQTMFKPQQGPEKIARKNHQPIVQKPRQNERNAYKRENSGMNPSLERGICNKELQNTRILCVLCVHNWRTVGKNHETSFS